MAKINKRIYLLLIGLLLLIPRAQAEWTDFSSSVEITKTPQALDRINRVLFSYVTITNTSAEALVAPVRLVITNPNIPVLNATGVTEKGNSYLEVAGGLADKANKTVRVDFQLAKVKVVFETQLEQFLEISTKPQLVVPTKIPQDETDQYGVGLTGAEFTDATGNMIRIYLPDIHQYDELTIKQGVDLGNISYQYNTNKIIEISFPPELSSKQLLVITPSQDFEYVYQFDPTNKQMLRMPFLSESNGDVLLKLKPIGGAIYFALVHK